MQKLFGTDGIRATAGEYPLDYNSVYTLGHALIVLLRTEKLPPRVIIGRDTRESGQWIEQALFQGIEDGNGEAVSAGLIPTSAISFLTKRHGFSAGIVISASHNPYQDNGIKIFSDQGTKIANGWEEILERAIIESVYSVQKRDITVSSDNALSFDYIKFLKNRFGSVRLPRKIKIVLDCSNGASSHIAPMILSDLGFDVIAINASPDGMNINKECGSLYPQKLAKKVVETGADIGVAYDGDADRALWVDERGRILNGDHTLFALARFMKEKKRLKTDTVVATTMSNMGLEKGLGEIGLKLVRTKVGDKYVLEEMMKIHSNLGGEQSGHTIFLDDCPTGDGILTSIKMLEVMAAKDTTLSSMVAEFEEYPQILKNVPVSKKPDMQKYPEIVSAIREVEKLLADSGRLNVRYSGTEPLARIMIEGPDLQQIEQYAADLASVLSKHLK
ncbi:MAG TPA: phosphoglucosamine mutase [Candidatus Heimdallarchaeota archaeon]|nr:phosphoglucosamine mutase [Candidatus Heimdallarchaeota archaeon]